MVTRGLILGGASCIWNDLEGVERVLGCPWDGVVIATNEAGAHWPGEVDHWVSYHPEYFPKWKRQREANGHPPTDALLWGRPSKEKWVDRHARHWGGGSSGLLAVSVASDLNLDRVVLAGVPITQTGHFHDRDDGRPWGHADHHWKQWKEVFEDGRLSPTWIRSMSGNTRELLGPPTAAWLRGEDDEFS